MSKTVWVLWVILMGWVGQFNACTPSNQASLDPKQRLTEYISRSFAIKKVEDKELLLHYLTGDSKARLQSWSADQFREAFIDSKRQFNKLSIREVKSVSDIEVQITYEISYDEVSHHGNNPSNQAKVTYRKLGQMLKENGKWYIADVRNIRQIIEFKDELTIP